MAAAFSSLGAGSQLNPIQQSLQQRGLDLSLADKISPAGGGTAATPSPMPQGGTTQNIAGIAPPPQAPPPQAQAEQQMASAPLPPTNESELIIKTLASRLKSNSDQGK